MGLDIVELIMEIEEHFGVSIPDAKAERIFTVSDLYVYLLSQTTRDPSAACPTSRAFHRLRRTLIEEMGVDRKAVRPSTPLRDLFPAQTRAAAWPRLAAALHLPDLPDPDSAPRGPSRRAFGIALAAATIVPWVVYLILNLLPGESTPIGIVFLLWVPAVLLVCVVFGVFWIDARRLHPVPKVRELVARLAAQHGELTPQGERGQRIWNDLVAILARQSGVPAARIRPEQGVLELFESWMGN